MSGPFVGEEVDYVSPFRTGRFDAVITRVWPDGMVALDVFLPGVRTGRDTTPTISLRAVTYGPDGRARPR